MMFPLFLYRLLRKDDLEMRLEPSGANISFYMFVLYNANIIPRQVVH